MTRGLFALILHLISLALIPTASVGADPQQPNIVFLFADDLGYGDLACYGSPAAHTPRLDQLAEEGARFTQFYVSHCVCSPTRASAITGQFPSRQRIYGHLAHFTTNRKRQMPDWLDVDAPSFPRALQAAGYRTAMIGKWHLGGGSGRTFLGSDLKTPDIDVSGRTEIIINHPDAPPVIDYGFDYARTTVGNSPTWKHLKLWPEPHEIYTYMDQDWLTFSSKAIADDTLAFLERHQRDYKGEPFYINAWFKDVHTPHRPTDEMLAPFADLPEKARDHYAMVSYMDGQIGRVLDALDRHGLRDNTLVYFSSDNGAGKDRGGSNGSLRGWKHTIYEGGIREPFIVRWPKGGVPAGHVDTTSVLNICDFVPTFSKIAGARMPEGYQSDGEDMIAALRGEPFERSQPQFWHYPAKKPSLAVRIGDWKLLTQPDGKDIELYNLASDIGETKNLAAENPKVVAELRKSLLDWYAELPLAKGGL